MYTHTHTYIYIGETNISLKAEGEWTSEGRQLVDQARKVGGPNVAQGGGSGEGGGGWGNFSPDRQDWDEE